MLARKIKNKTNRIKKKDFKRFSVYDDEMYMGTCLVSGVLTEDVWISFDNKGYTNANSLRLYSFS